MCKPDGTVHSTPFMLILVREISRKEIEIHFFFQFKIVKVNSKLADFFMLQKNGFLINP